jgi:hypothetical protein
MTAKQSSVATVLSLAQLLEQQPPNPPPCLVEPGLLPPQGILFVGGEPKVGKSLLVANLALALASGSDRTGFSIPAACRVLICQFELPVPQFVGRLAVMRRAMGTAADLNLLVDTRATGHLLCAPQGLNHFLSAAKAAAAEVIILDPLYSTHDQDENDTRPMAALCQSLLRLRDAAKAALIVVHLSRVVQYVSFCARSSVGHCPDRGAPSSLGEYTTAGFWRATRHIILAYSDARNSSNSGFGVHGAAWPSERSTVCQNASRACRFVFMFALVYRLVVRTLSWPNRSRTVTRSTPD